MDEDNRIQRLREYVQLYLRRTKEVENEQLRIQFLSEKSSIESGKSKIDSISKFSKRKNEKNKLPFIGNKERTKIFSEEIGRNLHTVGKEPYQYDDVYDDLAIDSYPVESGIYASISFRDGSSKKSMLFVTPEEADTWLRTTAMSMSKVITQ